MTIGTRGAAMTALLSCLLAAGCGADPDAPSAPGSAGAPAPSTAIGRAAAQAIDKAARKLQSENIRLGEHDWPGKAADAGDASPAPQLPRAELTPDGQLLVDGQPVPANAEQQALLREHRRHLEDVALAGMAIGVQGADIAGTALTGIGEALFGGDEGRRAYEARVEAEASRIKDEASRLCALLPALYDSQQALAAALPAFAPYATMTPQDVEDCASDLEGDGADAGGSTNA